MPTAVAKNISWLDPKVGTIHRQLIVIAVNAQVLEYRFLSLRVLTFQNALPE